MLAQNDNHSGIRRQSLRTRRFKMAQIITNADGGGVPVIIRNTSSKGAALELPANQKMAHNFVLRVDSDDTFYHCQLRWRDDSKMGVEILA